jgi:hypothetical protein
VRDRETLAALALAAFAGLRVLGFALAFPFFTNVDEFRHVDMALKYARGYAPGREGDGYEPETRRLVAVLGSLEYHRDPRRTSPLPPPVWRAGPEVLARRLERVEAELGPIRNLEANQSPFYYAVAGAWLRLGRALGLDGGPLLYWLRGLAAPAAFALVLASHRVLRRVHPDRFVRLGVPALLAFLPQDCVYYVTSDALSPLLGGVGFLLCVDLALRRAPDTWRGAATGAVGAAAILTKLPNAMLLPVAAFCALAARAQGGRREARAWFALGAALLVPLAAWLARNQVLLGDPTGDEVKIAILGWGRRPLSEWPAHPLLRPEGAGASPGSRRCWRCRRRIASTSPRAPPASRSRRPGCAARGRARSAWRRARRGSRWSPRWRSWPGSRCASATAPPRTPRSRGRGSPTGA